MNYGSIDKNTAAGQLYRIWKSEPGALHSAKDLADDIGTTCISTRVSEVRKQLPEGERVIKLRRVVNGKARYFYGLSVEGGGR